MPRTSHRNVDTGDVPVAAFADAIARLPASAHRGGLLYIAGARDTARARWHAAADRRRDHDARALLLATETSDDGARALLETMSSHAADASPAALALCAVVGSAVPGCEAYVATLTASAARAGADDLIVMARDIVASVRADLAAPDAIVALVAHTDDAEVLLPLALRRAADPERAVLALREAAEGTIDDDRARRLRELAVYTELFRIGRPTRALRHARALVDAARPSLPALWAAWFSAWETGTLADLVPMLRRRAFAAPQPLRDHLHAALADAALFVDTGLEDGDVGRISDASWQAAIRARRARPERHRAISGAFASVVDATTSVDMPDVLAVIDEGRNHLLHGRWSDATACFVAAADAAERPADRARVRRLAASAAALSSDPGASQTLILQALRDDPTAADTWQALLREVDAHDDVGPLVAASAEHGRPAHSDAARRIRALVRAHPSHLTDAVRVCAVALAEGMADDTDPFELADDADALSVAVALPALAEPVLLELAAHAAVPMLETTRGAIDAVADVALRTLHGSGSVRLADLLDHATPGAARSWLAERIAAAAGSSSEIRSRLAARSRDGDLDATWGLACALDQAGEREQAEQLARAVVAERPRHVGARRLLAGRARDAGRWDDVVAELEVAARNTVAPDARARLYREIGDVFSDQHDHPAAALENYLVAFVCASDDPATLARLDTTYRRLDRARELVGTLTVAVEHARRNPHSRLDVGEALVARARLEVEVLSDRARAGRSLAELVALTPDDDHAIELFLQVAPGHLDDAVVRRTVCQHLDALPADRREARRRSELLARWAS